MAADTLKRMITSHDLFYKDRTSRNPAEATAFRQTGQRLQFQHQMFKGLAMRSEANEKRLRNEINLVKETVLEQMCSLLTGLAGFQHGSAV